MGRHRPSLYSAAVAAPSTASSSKMDPIAIIGASGALGFGLALRLARTGVPIVIRSRDAERAADTAKRAQALAPDATFTGLDNGDAARAAEVVFLSVPFRNQSETLTNLKKAL